MSGAMAYRVFVALHATDHASKTLLYFGSLADKAAAGVAGVNKQLALMGSLAAVGIGVAGVGAMLKLAEASNQAYMRVAQLRLEMANLGLSTSQINSAQNQALGISMRHPAISLASGLHLYKDVYSVLGNNAETQQVMPFMSKFMLAMKGTYGERGDEMGYDAVRAAELQMGKHFNATGLMKYLDVYTKVVSATGGRIDPAQIYGFMKNSVYSRMSASPDAIAKEIMLMMEYGGPRAGTALNAIDRFAIAHIAQNGVSKEKMEKWYQYGLIEDVQRNKKGKITDFHLVQQDLYQKDRIDWLYKVFAPALQSHGVNPYDPSGIPKIAQMFSTQTGAAGAITTLLQNVRNLKEQHLYKNAAGVNEAASRYEKSPMGIWAGLHGATDTLLTTLGKALTPTFLVLAQGATKVVQAMTAWINAHPRLTQGLFLLVTAGFAAIAAIGGVVGAITLGLGPALAVVAAGLLGLAGWISFVAFQVPVAIAALKKLAAVIGLVFWSTISMVTGAAKHIPGLGGLGQTEAYAGVMANGDRQRLGLKIDHGNAPKATPTHVSNKFEFNIHGITDPRAVTAEIDKHLKNSMNELMSPKAGYTFNHSIDLMHGFNSF